MGLSQSVGILGKSDKSGLSRCRPGVRTDELTVYSSLLAQPCATSMSMQGGPLSVCRPRLMVLGILGWNAALWSRATHPLTVLSRTSPLFQGQSIRPPCDLGGTPGLGTISSQGARRSKYISREN